MEEDELFTEEDETVIEDEGTEATPNISGSRVTARRAQDLSLSLDIPLEQGVQAVEVGDKMFSWEAKRKASQSHIPIETEVRQGIERQEPLTDIQQRVADRLEKEKNFQEIDEYLIEQALSVDDPRINADIARFYTNQRIANDKYVKAIEDSNGNDAQDILSFVDWGLLAWIPRTWDELNRDTERTGANHAEALWNMDPKEFSEFVDTNIAEASQEGFFSSDNIWAYENQYSNALNLGYAPEQDALQLLAVLDFAPGVGAILGAGVRGVMRGSTALSSVTAIKGMKAGNAAAQGLYKNLAPNTDDGSLAATFSAQAMDVSKFDLRPSFNAFTETIRDNQVVQRLWKISNEGRLGRSLTEDEINAQATLINENIKNRSNEAVLDFNITRDAPESYVVTAKIGNNETSLPFDNIEDAQKIADKFDASRVVPSVDGRGYMIEVDRRLSTQDMSKAPSLADATYDGLRDIYRSVFGSANIREDVYLSSLAALGEQGLGRISSEVVTPIRKTLRKVKGKDGQRMDEILLEYRDGARSADRLAPSRAEFEKDWMSRYNERPSQEVLDGYVAIKDLNDAGWFLKANQKVQRAVQNGQVMVRVGPDIEVLGKRTNRSQVPSDARVKDVDTGASLKPDEVPEGAIIYSATDVIDDHRFFVNVDRTRIVEHSDVHGYNFGGPRVNPEFRHFVGYAGQRTLAGGETVGGRWKSALGSFSRGEAEKAVTQMNAIRTRLREIVDEAGLASWKDIRGTRFADEVNTLIKKNNEWNPNVTKIDELVAFSEKTGVNFAEEADFVARERGLPVTKQDAGLDDSLIGGDFDSVLEYRGNTGPRLDDVLMEFGGRKPYNQDPIEAISGSFSASTISFANSAYINRAMAGWVKAARSQEFSRYVTPPKGVKEGEYFRFFRDAEIVKEGRGRALEEQREIIMRRMGLTGGNRYTKLIGDILSEAFFKASRGKVRFDFNDGSASSALLKVGFHSKMGFLNVGQLIVQSMQVPVITAISPLGYKGATMALVMRPLAALGDDAARQGAKNVAKSFGLRADEIDEILDYIRDSGRMNVDVEAAELQTGIDFTTRNGVGSLASGILDKGAAPFREGERISRLTAELTAILEFKQKFPETSLKSDFALTWIASRDQDLSFRMTATSRSLGQDGLLRIPTQWLSYTFRTLQELFVGRRFSRAERIRMSVPLVFMWGYTGIGLDYFLPANDVQETVGNMLGLDPGADNAAFRLMKYGVIDTLIGEMVGEGAGSAAAPRLAPLGQISQTIETFTEESLLEGIFGPSGGIATDIVGVFLGGLGNLMHGNYELAMVDAEKVIRNISTLNNTEIARGIWLDGKYRAKSGAAVPGDFGTAEALYTLLGFQPEQVAEYYDIRSSVYTNSKKVSGFIKDHERVMAEALDTLKRDPSPAGQQRYRQLMAEIAYAIDISGFSEKDKIRVRTGLLTAANEDFPTLMQTLVERGMDFELERLAAQQGWSN